MNDGKNPKSVSPTLDDVEIARLRLTEDRLKESTAMLRDARDLLLRLSYALGTDDGRVNPHDLRCEVARELDRSVPQMPCIDALSVTDPIRSEAPEAVTPVTLWREPARYDGDEFDHYWHEDFPAHSTEEPCVEYLALPAAQMRALLASQTGSAALVHACKAAAALRLANDAAPSSALRAERWRDVNRLGWTAIHDNVYESAEAWRDRLASEALALPVPPVLYRPEVSK